MEQVIEFHEIIMISISIAIPKSGLLVLLSELKPKTENRKPFPFATPAHARADALAAELLDLRAALGVIQAEAVLDLGLIKEFYAPRLATLKVAAASLDKKIKGLAKRERAAFFQRPGDQVTLPHIVLTFAVEEHVKQVEGVLANLEDLALLQLAGAPGYEGFAEAIRTEKSVRYEVLDKWPAARLLMVGAERVKKEVYSYELRGEAVKGKK